jgi:hypothetical protein
VSIHYRIAEISDLAILIELVREFHENEKLPFDENIDADVLRHFLADESLGKAYLVRVLHPSYSSWERDWYSDVDLC